MFLGHHLRIKRHEWVLYYSQTKGLRTFRFKVTLKEIPIFEGVEIQSNDLNYCSVVSVLASNNTFMIKACCVCDIRLD